jgi:protein TonB
MIRFCAALVLAAAFTVSGWSQEAARKVTRNEAMNAVQSRVEPEYPSIARQLKVQGTVELEALVGESGRVEEVKIVSGNPVLTAPATAALKKWKFAPFTDDGKAVKALAPVNFNFHLGN